MIADTANEAHVRETIAIGGSANDKAHRTRIEHTHTHARKSTCEWHPK